MWGISIKFRLNNWLKVPRRDFKVVSLYVKSHCFPPLLSGQSVGGALTSAKSAMSSWFSTLSQPAAVTTPVCPEPATEVKPWNWTRQSSDCVLVLWASGRERGLLLWRRKIIFTINKLQVWSVKHGTPFGQKDNLLSYWLYSPDPLWGRDRQHYCTSKPRAFSRPLPVWLPVCAAGCCPVRH